MQDNNKEEFIKKAISESHRQFHNLITTLMEDFGNILNSGSIELFEDYFIGNNGILSYNFIINSSEEKLQNTLDNLMFLSIDNDTSKQESIVKNIIFIYSKKHYNQFAELFIKLNKDLYQI